MRHRSGHTALTTLMHEAGHAAHFANIEQPSPLFAQERAPTSVAYAELQSMFLDSLVGDAAWRGRYARDREGKPVPWELVESDLRSNHPYKVVAPGMRTRTHTHTCACKYTHNKGTHLCVFSESYSSTRVCDAWCIVCA